MGRAYLWALPSDERARFIARTQDHYGTRWPRCGDGIERSGEMVTKFVLQFLPANQNDVHAVGVALRLNDGTGPYAFNCGAALPMSASRKSFARMIREGNAGTRPARLKAYRTGSRRSA